MRWGWRAASSSPRIEATSPGVLEYPRATIATGQTDAVLGIEEIGPVLVRLVETGKLA